VYEFDPVPSTHMSTMSAMNFPQKSPEEIEFVTGTRISAADPICIGVLHAW